MTQSIETIIRKTKSVCPVCLRTIPAELIRREEGIYISRTCPDHGLAQSCIWHDAVDFDRWIGEVPMLQGTQGDNCPGDCGLCSEHLRDTCCTILEVTERCNLRCRYCFAGEKSTEDRSLEDVKRDLEKLVVPGKTLVQLSGGEPTVREDLPEIIAHAKKVGCKYVQLNTNGLRLARENGYAQQLADAGLSFVFLQFDGLDNDVYRAIRGGNLLNDKLQCIIQCAQANLGVVLVVTVVPGINDKKLGEVLRFGIGLSPKVRGVHFQPVTYLGEYPGLPGDSQRMTLDMLIREVCEQSEGLIQPENLAPSHCDHPLCGFHGDFIAMPGNFLPLTHWDGSNPRRNATADQNREFVGRRWERPDSNCCQSGTHHNAAMAAENGCCCASSSPQKATTTSGESCCRGNISSKETTAAPVNNSCCSGDATTLDGFLNNVKYYGFTVTSMAFQDAENLNIERLRYCSSHVYKNGKFIPLCANYLSARKQGVSKHPGGLELTERLLNLSKLEKGATLADIGCGEGASVSWLRNHGFRATGVERDGIVCAENLPFADESMDALLYECVLCLTDREKALSEARRVLKLGGKLLVSDVMQMEERPTFPGFRPIVEEDHQHELIQWVAQAILDGRECDFAPSPNVKYTYRLMVLEK